MNILVPIIVIILGAVVYWFLTYIAAPKPFFIALYTVLVIVAIIWLAGLAGYGPVLMLNPPSL